MGHWFKLSALLLAALVYVWSGTLALSMTAQAMLALPLIIAAIFLGRIKGQDRRRKALMLLATACALRYVTWRVCFSLDFQNLQNGMMSISLFAAELYSILMTIGFYLETWNLDRSHDKITDDPNFCPSVDVFITTYDENLDILRRTAAAAVAIKYPNKKVYILDDGRRQEVEQLANDVGCEYIARKDNTHAKAGNINNALTQTEGELILFLDADHVPVSSFLKRTIHYFKDPKLAIVQTPHRFINAGPIEKNLYMDNVLPSEQQLFYQVVQVGKHHWNASFFCGSAGIIRRSALLEVGGMGTKTVTEDCETSIKIHGLGYKSIFYTQPLISGLAPESFSGYVIQQTRWARGSIQLLRLLNPLTYPGLSFGQRFCYFHGLCHYFYAIPRLIFYVAPCAFLLFDVHPLNTSFLNYFMMGLPYLFLSYIANSYIFYKFRHSFWSDIYDATLVPILALTAMFTLINPSSGKFHVTPKGCRREAHSFDFALAWPNLFILSIFCASLIVGIIRLMQANLSDQESIVLNMFWLLYSTNIVLSAVLSAVERPFNKRAHNVTRRIPLSLHAADGKSIFVGTSLEVTEFDGELLLDKLEQKQSEADLAPGQNINMTLHSTASGMKSFSVALKNIKQLPNGMHKANVQYCDPRASGLYKIIPAIYCDSSTWQKVTEDEDHVWRGAWTVFTTPARWANKTLLSMPE